LRLLSRFLAFFRREFHGVYSQGAHCTKLADEGASLSRPSEMYQDGCDLMERNEGARGDGHKPGTLRQKLLKLTEIVLQLLRRAPGLFGAAEYEQRS